MRFMTVSQSTNVSHRQSCKTIDASPQSPAVNLTYGSDNFGQRTATLTVPACGDSQSPHTVIITKLKQGGATVKFEGDSCSEFIPAVTQNDFTTAFGKILTAKIGDADVSRPQMLNTAIVVFKELQIEHQRKNAPFRMKCSEGTKPPTRPVKEITKFASLDKVPHE